MALAGVVGAVACGSNAPAGTPEPLCLDKPADATCTKVPWGVHNGQIAPTFTEIFENLLNPSCARPECHSGANPQNGLSFDDQATAYADLMKTNVAGTNPRVKPNDLQCGELIVRLETPNESWSMPKGSHLSDDLLCVIRHWIAEGAPND